MYFTLWSMDSNNAISEFKTERDALAAVREIAHEYGRAAASTLILMRDSRRGNSKSLGHGEALLNRAFRRAPKAGKGAGSKQRADDSVVRPDVMDIARQIIEKNGEALDRLAHE